MAPVSQGEVSEEDAALQEENAALQQRLEALEAELREEKAYAYTVVHGYITDAEMIYMETMAPCMSRTLETKGLSMTFT